MRGYLDAVHPAQFRDVELGRVVRRVERARLGLHLQLARLAERFDGADGAKEMARAIGDYLSLIGLETDGATGTEVLVAYAEVRALNNWQWDLPFMREERGPMKPPPYDYPDRNWAWWVHKLSSRYGWSRDEIFDLWPEEAACYLQEIFVSEIDESEARRSLSELAYRYDKGSKRSHFIPTPRPAWMVDSGPPKRYRIRRDMLPVGNVIKLEDEIIH